MDRSYACAQSILFYYLHALQDTLLQVGDLGVFPEMKRLDRSTRRHSTAIEVGLDFLNHFIRYEPAVAERLQETSCPVLFVRGNHEDHAWLDTLEQQVPAPAFAVDVYQRLYCLKTGMPFLFTQGEETLTILGIGRIGRPAAARKDRPYYLQPDEQQRLARLDLSSIDVLLTHDGARDQIYVGSGSEEIGRVGERQQPVYHFFGHYGGPCQHERLGATETLSFKLADLHPEYQSPVQAMQAGAMGILSWHGREPHTFTINCQKRPA